MKEVKRITKEVKIAMMEHAKSQEAWDIIGNRKYVKTFEEKYAQLLFYVKTKKIKVYKCEINEIKNYKILTFNKYTFINT